MPFNSSRSPKKANRHSTAPPTPDGVSKRNLGQTSGNVLVLGCPDPAVAQGPPRIAEGVADALALSARFPGPAIATLGISTAKDTLLIRWLAAWPSVIVHADADLPGEKAARALRRCVQQAGGRCRAVLPGVAGRKDAAAIGEPFAALDRETSNSFAETLREMHEDWPIWEIYRMAAVEMAAEGTE